jgi:acetyl-CoA carboxylase biotin carboxyl carrier protein
MIDLRYVKRLIEMLDGSSVDSIEISTEKGLKIRISKAVARHAPVETVAPVAAVPILPAVEARVTPGAGLPAMSEPEPAPRPEPEASRWLEVKSPMVGTFYAAPEPGAKPYVSAGTRIQKGQILCIIEAMKIMNEIESEFAGVVREVLVTDAHPVEYGQVLFRIDPHG